MRFWLLIDESGRVGRSRLIKQGQTPWISGKARDIATRLRFEPAMDEGESVAVWHQYALVFEF